MRSLMRQVTRCVGVAVLALSASGVASPVFAQAAGAPAASRPELQQLKSRIDERFQVVVLKRGIVLVPRQRDNQFNSIEVADDGLVLVDGSAVTGRELRNRVSADADVVARLSFLDAAERRALFAVGDQTASKPPAERPDESAAGEIEDAPPAPGADTGWVERDRHRRGGARVRVGGDVWVKEDEVAGDAVVAVFGTARVDGRVDGDVVAVGGGVQLGPKADVRGNVVSVGGAVERAPGARVDGDLNEVRVGFPSFRLRPWQNWHWFGSPFGATADLFASLLRMAIVTLFAAMIVALAGAPVRRVAGVAAAEPWRAAFAGLAAQIFFVPLLVLTVIVLAVSIIGIPLLLLVPFGLLAALVALVMGFAGVGCAIGDAIGRRSGRGIPNLFASLVVGLAVIWALTAVARFAGLGGGPIRVLAGIVLTAGFVVEFVAWTVGLGAVLISRFGKRGPAVPPPLPELDLDGPPAVQV